MMKGKISEIEDAKLELPCVQLISIGNEIDLDVVLTQGGGMISKLDL